MIDLIETNSISLGYNDYQGSEHQLNGVKYPLEVFNLLLLIIRDSSI